MRQFQAVLLVAILTTTIFPADVGAQASTAAEWWGPRGIDGGWHMRTGLTVANPYATTMADGLVAFELDMARALISAGWPSFRSGPDAYLAGFDLDPDSVRVVEMTNLAPASSSRPTDGRIIAEVASVAYEGGLGRTEAMRAFDPSNPLMTVLFQVPGNLAPGQERSFYVYYDSRADGGEAPASYAPAALGPLRASHWVTSGVRLFGAIPAGQEAVVTVLGSQPNANVQVSVWDGAAFTTAGVQSIRGNPFTIGTGEHIRVGLPGTSPIFMVRSIGAPVSAFVDAAGFVPSETGGLRGKAFTLRTGQAEEDGAFYVSNPNDAPVQVSVDGNTFTLAKNGDPGSTGGARWGCAGAGGAWSVPRTSTTHRVTASADVMVQLQPTAKMQLPATTGHGVGTRFAAAALWSHSGDCTFPQGQGFQATAWSAAANIHVVSPDSTLQVFPRGAPAVPYPAPQALATRPALSGPYSLASTQGAHRDGPLIFTADADVAVFAGGIDPRDGTNTVAGPLGGADSRAFVLPGAATVIALYPDTHITGAMHGTQSDAIVDVVRGANEVLRLDGAGLGTWLYGAIEADRPIVVIPTLASPGFLAGEPAFLATHIKGTEFRGRVIAIAGPGGEDPIAKSTPPGKEIAFDVEVSNFGRGLAGDRLDEVVDLELAGVPGGWSARLGQLQVAVPAGASRTVQVFVTPAPGSATGATALMTLRGTSQANAAVTADVDLATFVKSEVGIGIWFLQELNGPKTLGQTIVPGATASYPVVVKNLGSVPETVRLSIDGNHGGAVVELLDDGVSVSTLQLGALASRMLELRIAPSPDVVDAVLFSTITAQGTRVASSLDRITATTRVRGAGDVELTSLQPFVAAADGENASFALTVHNAGASSAELILGVIGDNQQGWPVPKATLWDPVKQVAVPLTGSISLSPGQILDVAVQQYVPHGITAGRLFGLRAGLADPEGVEVADLVLSGIVDPRHELDLVAEASPGPPGLDLVPQLRITNRGNLDELLTVTGIAAPPGWRIASQKDIGVARNATATIALEVFAPNGTAAGQHAVNISVMAVDRWMRSLEVPLVIVPLRVVEHHVLPTQLVQPRETLSLEIPFTNRGNTNATVRLDARAGHWPVADADEPIRIATQQAGLVRLALTIPADAAEGMTSQDFYLKVQYDDGQVAFERVTVAFDVGRSDLVIDGADRLAGRGGSALQVVLRNDGARPARQVTVHVVDAAGETVAATIIEVLGAGDNATVLLPASSAGGVRVVLDAQDAISELREDNNAVALISASTKEAPAATLVLAVLVLLGTVALMRIQHDKKNP